MASPETAGMRSRVVIWDSVPTVTATPTVTRLMMTARAVALPFEPTCTGGGLTAGSAVRPARYWPGGVPAGTCRVNCSLAPVPAGSATRAGRPVTQQPGPEQLREDRLNALPPLAAVTPVDRLTFSSSAVRPRLLMIAVPVAESPAATVNMKYGAARPA